MERQELENTNDLLKQAVNKLKGTERRVLLAKIAISKGKGGQIKTAEEFGAGRDTIRLGMHELRTGIACIDGFNLRGRNKVTDNFPNLEKDLREILDPQSQIDPTFKSDRMYTRLTLKNIQKELIKRGYSEETLPCIQTISDLLKKMAID